MSKAPMPPGIGPGKPVHPFAVTVEEPVANAIVPDCYGIKYHAYHTITEGVFLPTGTSLPGGAVLPMSSVADFPMVLPPGESRAVRYPINTPSHLPSALLRVHRTPSSHHPETPSLHHHITAPSPSPVIPLPITPPPPQSHRVTPSPRHPVTVPTPPHLTPPRPLPSLPHLSSHLS
ncbi:hypothetical protein JCM24511_01228 [Saitozyma sp. JCM 24511]|nr:hypothetical protein JCM24511_01228 [Saitozyma sp. JCM 24511]